MSVAALLFGYAAVMALLGPRLLDRAAWPRRAPRLGILAWLTLASSSVLAALLGCVSLAIPPGALGHDLADLIHACIEQLRLDYGAADGAVIGIAGAAAVAGLLTRLGYATIRTIYVTRRIRARQRRALSLLVAGDAGTGDDVVIVASMVPAAYCVPGHRVRIVLTDAALRALDPDQVAAVLAHERRHLRGRHHVVLAATTALRRAFPGVPIFRRVHEEVGQLLEMLADDAAARDCAPQRLAAALLTLADGAAPATTLAAGGPGVLCRLDRLFTPPQALGAVRACGTAAVLFVVLAAPAVIAAGPAVAAATAGHCPVDLTGPSQVHGGPGG